MIGICRDPVHAVLQPSFWWLRLTLLLSPSIPSLGSAWVPASHSWFLVPGRCCLFLVHTTTEPKSCKHSWMLSAWSVSSPFIGLFIYSNCVFCLVSSWIQEYSFYFSLGPQISLVSSFLSGHPRQTMSLASFLSPLATGICRISQCVFMWRFIVPLVCVWVSWEVVRQYAVVAKFMWSLDLLLEILSG